MKKILSLVVCAAFSMALLGCGEEKKAPTTTPEQKKSMEEGMGGKMKGGAKPADAPKADDKKADDKKPAEPAKK